MSDKKILLKAFLSLITDFPYHFISLFIAISIELFFAFCSIISVVPLADYLLNPRLDNPSKITELVIEVLSFVNIEANLITFVLIFSATNFLKSFSDITIKFVVFKIKNDVFSKISLKSLKIFFDTDLSFFNSENPGIFLNSFNFELGKIAETFSSFAKQLTLVAQLLIYMTIPFFIDARMTLIAYSLSLIFFLPFLYLNKINYKLGERNTNTSNSNQDVIMEILNSFKLIISNNKEKYSLTKYEKSLKMHIKANLQSSIFLTAIPTIYQPIAITTGLISVVFSLSYGSSFSEVAAVLWSILRSMPILSNLLHENLKIINTLPSYSQILELTNRASKLKNIGGTKKFISLKKEIKFSNVCFKYPKRLDLIKNLSFSIKANKITAITGPSGSGKSTIIDLILRLQKPYSGIIYFDDTIINKLDLYDLRSNIGYVSQEPLLIKGSIKDNLSWSNPSANQNDIIEACKQANAYDFIKKMPEGLNTFVGDKGNQLSGGQRQRITLARALIKKPSFLILDEVTSSLDIKSEKIINNCLKKLSSSTTILLITHKASSLKIADYVYHIEKQ